MQCDNGVNMCDIMLRYSRTFSINATVSEDFDQSIHLNIAYCILTLSFFNGQTLSYNVWQDGSKKPFFGKVNLPMFICVPFGVQIKGKIFLLFLCEFFLNGIHSFNNPNCFFLNLCPKRNANSPGEVNFSEKKVFFLSHPNVRALMNEASCYY